MSKLIPHFLYFLFLTIESLPAGLHKAVASGGNAVGHSSPAESASRAVRKEDGRGFAGEDEGETGEYLPAMRATARKSE